MKWNHYAGIPAGLLLAFGIIVSGCGNTSSPATSSPSVPPTAEAAEPAAAAATDTAAANASAAADAEGAMRTVSTVKGDVQVPGQPNRIVTDHYAGYLLALDIVPVGSPGLYLQSPYLEGMTEGITEIGDDLEAIIALEPDLIIAGNADSYEAYSKIAPTVLLPGSLSVKEKMALLGDFVNRQEAAADWAASFDRQTAAAKVRANSVLGNEETVTVFAGGIVKQQTVYGAGFTGYTIYEVLGLPMQNKVAEITGGEQKWANISSEVLTDYAGDHIFVAVDLANETYDYASDPLWGTLDAVKNNRLYEIDGWRFWFSDPISLAGQANDIADLLVERSAENGQ